MDNIDSDFNLHWQNVLFGFNSKGNKHNESYIIHVIIILAKYHIDKSKCSIFLKMKPSHTLNDVFLSVCINVF